MALFFEGGGSACLFFDSYDDDIGVRRYVREQGEHCGARYIGRAGNFGLCSFGCVDNEVCGFIYGRRASGEICDKMTGSRVCESRCFVSREA